ncbi:MAG TPA: glycerophosphodiester phosphodiesterase [Vicinamibacterales bacterium]|nr:glycerophosphodiester phosphodiesterase [Vicinamibacterales bacterium]
MRNNLTALAVYTCLGAALVTPVTEPAPPIVIAHRGASGYLPEHTLAAYELAVTQGADFIEPDLVATKDHVLVARHEVNITDTTDVSQRSEYGGRKTTKVIDGVSQSGWFADDFTLAEIKTLRAVQRLDIRSRQYDRLYEIPTFIEVIALAQRLSDRTGRTIGVYPETKHPSYHAQHGLALERPLVENLVKAGWNRRDAPVFIQSFEVDNLRALRPVTPVRLVQLVEDGDDARLTAAGLAEIATYADGVAPAKRHLVNSQGVAATDLVTRAHAAKLFVHTWTMRNEREFLLDAYKGNPVAEYLQFFCLGVDGVFSDFPDTAHTARELFRLTPQACDQ